jgi:hypothetical protein
VGFCGYTLAFKFLLVFSPNHYASNLFLRPVFWATRYK